MSLPSTKVDHPAVRLRQRLAEHMYRKDEPTKCFITGEVINKCWPESSSALKRILGLDESWTDDELRLIQDKIKRITCILVWIGADDFDTTLRRLLQLEVDNRTHPHVSPSVEDSDLPLTQELCNNVFPSVDVSYRFYTDQFIFKTIAISSFVKGIQDETHERRWPFEQDPVPIGSGGYGNVSRVVVVKGQLRRQQNNSNHDNEEVAVKQLREEKAWLKEVKSLDTLKESLAEHKRLVLHLAAIIRGQEFLIFFPYTPLGDLETFMREGYIVNESAGDAELYNFGKTFPHACLQDILNEFASLTNAIDFLHNKVSSGRNVPVYCAHVDLRPHNVLVFPDNDNPVGIWKISDFGISSFKLETGKPLPEPARSEFPSIGDIGQKRWSRGGLGSSSLPELTGPHRGPELIVRGYPIGPRASDIWALACILCELLVFGTGHDGPGIRKERLQRFRNQRPSFQDDGGISSDSFYDRRYSELGGSAYITFSIRPKVDEWLDVLCKSFNCSRVVAVLRRMLHPDPSKRLDSNEACRQISAACPISDSTNEPTETKDASPIWRVKVQISDGDGRGGNTIRYFEEDRESDIASEASDSVQVDSLNKADNMRPKTLRIDVTKRPPRINVSVDAHLVRIAPSNDVAVYLRKAVSTTPRESDATYSLRFKSLRELPEEGSIQGLVDHQMGVLPPDIDWKHLVMGERYLIVRGPYKQTRLAGLSALHIVDLQTKTTLQSPLAEQDVAKLRRVVATCGESLAMASSRSLWAWVPGQAPQALLDLTQPYALVDIALNRCGSYLFAWWGSGNGDTLQIWKVDNTTKPEIWARADFSQQGRRTDGAFILPCGDLPACILRDSQGLLSTVFAPQGGGQQVDAKDFLRTNKLNLPRSSALCSTTNHLVVCLDQASLLRVHRLVFQDNSSMVVEGEAFIKVQKCDIPDAQSVCLREEGGVATNYVLNICNARGDIAELKFGPDVE